MYMYKKFSIILCLFCAMYSMSQDTLNFKGDLHIQSTVLPITLQIINQKDTTLVFMGSPAQTKELVAASKTKITEDSVKVNIKSLSVRVRLKYSEDKQTLTGTFKQGAFSTDITFNRTESQYTMQRPQTPQPPFDYVIKELQFKNPDCAYDFHGTLTYPKCNGKFPCVVLVSGSGCQDRDENIGGHRPFFVIADYLTKNGIAVFRYDDRGFGSKDTNMYRGTTMDFAEDTRCAINMLKEQKEIDANNIIVLGHSEGGLIAQILGAKYKDIKALVFMAAPSINGRDILITQTEAMLKAQNYTKEQIEMNTNTIRNTKYDTNSLNGYWFDYFCKFDPKDYLTKLKMPILVLQGEKDIQVLLNENIPLMKKYLKRNKKVEYKLYPELNHLFQQCTTGTPDEYIMISQTIDSQVLQDIKDFVLSITK